MPGPFSHTNHSFPSSSLFPNLPFLPNLGRPLCAPSLPSLPLFPQTAVPREFVPEIPEIPGNRTTLSLSSFLILRSFSWSPFFLCLENPYRKTLLFLLAAQLPANNLPPFQPSANNLSPFSFTSRRYFSPSWRKTLLGLRKVLWDLNPREKCNLHLLIGMNMGRELTVY